MAELAVAAVEQYTKGRLAGDAPETARLLAAGLSTARRFCGWHVTPVREDDVVTLDGPGGRLLTLPTLALVELTSVVEDGAALDLADLRTSTRGLVTKKSGGLWSQHYGSIVVTMTHGYDDAPAFDAAVLSLIDRMSLAPAGGRMKAVGPFQYEDTSQPEKELLASYRLEASP